MVRQRPQPIAIVGVGALYPGSQGPAGFWHDIVNGVDRITEVPPTHWLVSDYYDPDPKAIDKTYCKRGAFLGPVPFDPLEFGIPPAAIPATDTAQLLALIVAKRVLDDASRQRFGAVDRRRTSVILGVASATELVVSMGARLQRPVWVKALREGGLMEEQVQALCDRIAAGYVPWQENTFPGLLGNVVAGRIANRLDLGGTNMVTDAACASSFAALSMAVNELRLGQSDLVLAGGVDAFNDVVMFMSFSKTPALSRSGDCRPFAEAADGTIIGEGVGMFALRRLDDAERDGNHIYAVVCGIGASSDGQATSVYAPLADGQAQALERAYEQAGYTPRTVELVEGHGTATKAGDAAEFAALRTVFANASHERQWCALGSVKSQIGHTKAAAGAAGLFKAVMALNHKILPPTIKVERPSNELAIDRSPFYLNCDARPWIADPVHPRRASVSSFGFGGSNFHVTLEEYAGDVRAPRFRSWAHELVLFSAPSAAQFARQCAAAAPSSSLQAVARESQRHFDRDAPVRAAIVVKSIDELRDHMDELVRRLGERQLGPLPSGCSLATTPPSRGRLAFVFPGQGSQYPGMGVAVAMAFDAAREIWDADARTAGSAPVHRFVFPHSAFDGEESKAQMAALTATEIAQPAITATSLSILAILERLGLVPDAVAGHSSGEITALGAAGVLDRAEVIGVARRRGALMAAAAVADGAMAAVGAGCEIVTDRLQSWGLSVVVANDNGPEQVVISGPSDVIAEAVAHFTRDGIAARPLSVATAFHSPIVAPSVEPFARFLAELEVREPAIPVYANTTAAPYPHETEAIVALLAGQIAARVRFRETVAALYASGVRDFVEVGPGNVLTGLIGQSLKGREHEAIALDRRGESGLATFWEALGRLAVLGYPLDFERLWEGFQVDTSGAQSPGEHVLLISGANFGKPYPPPNGAAGVPPPNPPRTEPAPPPPAPADSRDWTSAQLAIQLQAAESHAAFQRTMAEAHQAYLDLVGQAMQSHSSRVNGAPHVVPEFRAMLPQLPAQAEPSPVPARMEPPPVPARMEPPPVPPAVNAPPASLDSLLMEIVAEKTGYPVTMLRPEMELESDLGIDSIKQVEILSAVRQRVPDAPDLEPTKLAELRSLGRIVAYLRNGKASTPDASIERRVLRIVPAPRPVAAARKPRRIAIISDGDDLASEMVALFAERGLRAFMVTRPGDEDDAVVSLSALAAGRGRGDAHAVARDAFLTARAIAPRYALPHVAIPLDRPGRSSLDQLFHAATRLYVAGIDVACGALEEVLDATRPAGAALPDERASIVVRAHLPSLALPLPARRSDDGEWRDGRHMTPAPRLPSVDVLPVPFLPDLPGRPGTRAPAHHDDPIVALLTEATARHEAFVAGQTRLHRAFLALWKDQEPQLRLGRAELEVHALGEISEIFGPRFREQDGLECQVRMPGPPLLLVDRVTGIEGEPGSMGLGAVWTETDVAAGAWYLHHGRMASGVVIECGQADLLLISWLGADFLNRGERVYRLLGCEVTFFGDLPKPGETLAFEIHVDGHANSGDVRLFFFHYDCKIGGQIRLSVRNGQAGFFTREELAASRYVLWSAEEETPKPDARLDAPYRLTQRRAFGPDLVRAFLEGDAFACFGEGFEFAAAHQRTPTIPSGRLKAFDEVTVFEPDGGPWRRGYLRAEAAVEPGQWFYENHFKNDPCMPGTLMADAALQAMSFYLAALGFTIERDGWRFEPAKGEAFTVVCRGQVTPDRAHRLVYEVFVEEIVVAPYPTLYASLLCTCDGLKVFHCRRFGMRLVPDWPLSDRQALVARYPEVRYVHRESGVRGDYATMLACAWGAPSACFGSLYAHFDAGRRVSRLPGEPITMLSRVLHADCAPGHPVIGATMDSEYDVDPGAWYFSENGCPVMPFSLLLEAILQPCGWMGSYLGLAGYGEQELFFRNLDGQAATARAEIGPDVKRILVRLTVTNIVRLGSTSLAFYTVESTADGRPLLALTSSFVYVDPGGLARQTGLPATDSERARVDGPSDVRIDLRTLPPELFTGTLRLPSGRLLMVDEITGLWPASGESAGRIRGRQRVDPSAWYFKAHFFQDPVQPGSLGIEALLQLVQAWMILGGHGRRIAAPRFQAIALDAPFAWKYRGQVVPTNGEVVTLVDIKRVTEDDRGVCAVANGTLWVDGLKIYQVDGLTVRIIPIFDCWT